MSNIGEFDYIKRFTGRFKQHLPGNVTGIGDDCAVIPLNETESYLLTTDTLVDSVHFLSDQMPDRAVAYKALMVNLSDIAAMGGKPLYALLALTVPKGFTTDRLDSFFDGIYQGCRDYGVHLIGGDLTTSPDKLVAGITVIGIAKTNGIKFRSTAKIGDLICVTGIIGDSVGGLTCYLESLAEQHNSLDLQDIEVLKTAHLYPRPHIEEGTWLANLHGVNAMIDISDGIESDIKRITESSGCGAVIELTALPLSPAFTRVAASHGWNGYEMAVTGGEDYCLLLTVQPERYDEIARLFAKQFGRALNVIGTISESGLVFTIAGKEVKLQQHGYDHFRACAKETVQATTVYTR